MPTANVKIPSTVNAALLTQIHTPLHKDKKISNMVQLKKIITYNYYITF